MNVVQRISVPAGDGAGWTADRVESLKKHWADGWSATMIAVELGGITRNAVIGKVSRLGLPGRRPGSTYRVAKPKKPRVDGRVRLRKRSEAPAAAFVHPAPPIAKRISLLQLNAATCKFPLGDPLADDFAYCGCQVRPRRDEEESSPSYCSYHDAICHGPLSQRIARRRQLALREIERGQRSRGPNRNSLYP